MRYQDASPPELHHVTSIEVTGDAHIEVQEMDLQHQRLGSVEFAHGETSLAGGRAVVVITEEDSGPRVTVRPRQERPRTRT